MHASGDTNMTSVFVCEIGDLLMGENGKLVRKDLQGVEDHTSYHFSSP